MERIFFRKACERDVNALRVIARNSEAVWGFSEAFLQTFDESYNITTNFAADNTVYVMEQENVIVGFWGLILREQSAELEFFYINSSMLRMGYGRQLWNHLSEWCSMNNIKRIDFVTSHPAVNFYMKCGAKLSGTTCSAIDGREIPKLYCEFEQPE